MVAFLEHARDHAARLGQPLLQPRPLPLGLEDVAGFAVDANRHQLERHLPRMPRVVGEEDRRHPAAANLADDLVRPDALEDGRHRRPRPGREAPAPVLGGSMNQLSRTIDAAMAGSAALTDSAREPMNVFETTAGAHWLRRPAPRRRRGRSHSG